ncbi:MULTISPECIES: SDR family NAD(P)-dependent oxidoreductase [Methylomonas]|uniref:SDR family NAD(P)-dependent oxidoreductase n=1 Tax=Methylomonas TaxID=416 RepID=UPI001232CE97|nr:SDR family NAD(P)-dependent oxidoreductase [Methylomonas rhizoryzae]
MSNKVARKFIWITSKLVGRLRRLQTRLFQTDELEQLLAEIPRALSSNDLSGKVVVITGSSHGVGQVLAAAFAQAGASVVVNGRNASEVRQVVQNIQAAGGRAEGIAVDIASESGAAELIKESVARMGRVDILINNAAILGPAGQGFHQLAPRDWSRVIEVNLNGAFYCAREAAIWMADHAVAGRIINVSTGAARMPAEGIGGYSVSKCALEMMTRVMALEAAKSGLTVVAVELGSLRTPMTKAYFNWEEHQLLPPPEAVVPFFLHVATAAGDALHGRILAAWRYLRDPHGETLLNGPLAELDKFTFNPVYRDGVALNRFDPQIAALDRAENPFGMPAKVRELLQDAGQRFDFSRYPDENYPSLRTALSQKLKLPEDYFTFGNGSSELVDRILRTFALPGEEVLSNDPTWFMFDRLCQAMGIVNRKVPFVETAEGFDHNLQQMAREIRYNTRLIYLINPSNPLGVGIRAEAFAEFLQQVPAHIPVVVDEAYLEYSSNPGTLRSHEIVERSDRLVLGLRTFSKFYGLAGLRIGYAFGRREVMRLFERLEPLFCLTPLAEAAAVAALQDAEHAQRTLNNADTERRRIQARLAESGLRSMPGEMNVMIVECPVPPERVYQAYDAAGILMPRGVWQEKFIIFPIFRPEQNDRNLDILLNA